MGMFDSVRDFLLFRDLPANQPVTRSASSLQTRSTLSAAVPSWHVGKPTWPSDDVIVMTRDGYQKTVTAFACINIIADAVAEATLRVWIDEGSGKRDEEQEHPLRQLMQNPNPGKSEAEFLALTVRIAALAGYCVIEKVRSAQGSVVQLGHLRMDYLKPILRDQRAPDWQYTIPGQKPEVLSADDAVVFTYMDSPWLAVTGDTPLRAVLRQAGILNELTDFVKMLLERGGMPQVVLVVDPPKEDGPVERLTTDEVDAIRSEFARKYAGVRNWAGPAVLDGMHVEAVGLNLNEMAFKDLRDGVDLEVCRAFRVPAPVVQVMAGLTTSYGQTLEQSMKLLQMYTANPLRSRLDGALSRSLLPEFDVRPNVSLEFDTSDVDALQEDEDAVHGRARDDFRAGGITLDEFRQRIGEEALGNDLGKSIALPFSVVMTPVDAPVLAAVPEPEPDLDDENEDRGLPGWKMEAFGKAMMGVAQVWADYGALDSRLILRDGRTYVNRAAQTPAKRIASDQIATHQKQAIVRLSGALAPSVRTFLDEQRDRIIETIVGDRRSEPAWSRDLSPTAPQPEKRAIESIDWLSEDDALREVFRSWWELVGDTAFGEVSSVIGAEIVWNVSNPQLQNLFDKLGYRITGINETTRQTVETVIRESLIEGTTIDDMARSLSDVLDPTYRGRYENVARTESQIAYNLSSQAAYQTSGVVSRVQMHDNPEHDTDPGGDGLTCAERDGMVIDIALMGRHIEGEHPRGTLSFSPIVDPLEATP